MAAPVLSVTDLRASFFTPRGEARAVDGVSLDIHPGETLAVVGESGCGKTMVALSVLDLVPGPSGRVVGGSVKLGQTELRSLSARQMRDVRGNRIAMIFQEPMTSLNPVFRVGEQIAEPLRLHKNLSKRQAAEKAVELLAMVGIPNPARRARSYPHELSGGMRQRVVIAMALSCGPEVLLADEPTTALDVTIQAEILRLLQRLREEEGAGVMLITHDLGVVAEAADRAVVMYAGQVVEQADVRSLFRDPLHPYTRGLLESLPRVEEGGVHLNPIEGMVPSLLDLPGGCRFRPRCPRAFGKCPQDPPLFQRSGRLVRCWLHE
ncbi:ABC transporter ATP-binding protein [Desulfohalovibrio reitneri]|uniref:ABC transporter ATP-binding protein n=1 Tax=Desulfohalovibrio reitneri TaxID=1307759 RepID=UPI0004A6EC0F|nr:ABC transporter ATP-binding protein [Desulfohalovibrio reitneri]